MAAAGTTIIGIRATASSCSIMAVGATRCVTTIAAIGEKSVTTGIASIAEEIVTADIIVDVIVMDRIILYPELPAGPTARTDGTVMDHVAVFAGTAGLAEINGGAMKMVAFVNDLVGAIKQRPGAVQDAFAARAMVVQTDATMTFPDDQRGSVRPGQRRHYRRKRAKLAVARPVRCLHSQSPPLTPVRRSDRRG